MATPQESLELTLRGRAVAALAGLSLLGAWLSGDASVQLAAALLTAPLVADYAWKARSLSALVLRVLPRRAVAGSPFREYFSIENPTRARVRDLVLFERRTRSSPFLVAEIEAGSSRQAALACRTPERSHLLERVFDLATEWPLGLLRARATQVVPVDLVSEPRRVPQAALPLFDETDLDANPSIHARQPGEEFHALREHLDGEDARAVHARRSAALGTLVRTIPRGHAPVSVGLVLDLRRPPGRTLQHGRTRFEWSLSAAATLAELLLARDCRLLAVILGERCSRVRIHDEASLRNWLLQLAEAGPSLHRALQPDELAELDATSECYWLPAGGYRAPEAREVHRGEVRVVQGGHG